VAIAFLAILAFGIVRLRSRFEAHALPYLANRLGGTWIGASIFAAACLAACALCARIVFAALASGSISCFGRRCDGAYALAAMPVPYWIAVGIWSVGALFFLWATLYGIRKFVRSPASES
jgi:hypothetical protein